MGECRRFFLRNAVFLPAVDADGLGVCKIMIADRAMASGIKERCRMNSLEMTLEIGEISYNIFTNATIEFLSFWVRTDN